jgi:hypothetical protein
MLKEKTAITRDVVVAGGELSRPASCAWSALSTCYALLAAEGFLRIALTR